MLGHDGDEDETEITTDSLTNTELTEWEGEAADSTAVETTPVAEQRQEQEEPARTQPQEQPKPRATEPVVNTTPKKEKPQPATPAPTQTTTENKIYDSADVQPVFPGGQGALLQWLSKNVTSQGTSGRVIVSFVVEKNGSVSSAKVERSTASSLNSEALRVVRKMPRWTPGQKNGQTVRVRMMVPVVFI